MSAATRVRNWARDWARTNTRVTWTNHEPASALCQWYRANRNSAAPPLPAAPAAGTMMVCFELPMYAAVCSGAITARQLVGLYDQRWVDNLSWDQILKGSWFWHTYDIKTNSPTPAPGSIVFFDRCAHVALSTGNGARPGEIVSVWGLDPSGLAANTPIELTTIGALYGAIRQQTARLQSPQGLGKTSPVGNAVPDVKVEYAAPPW
jgi:hypothetical protein